MMKIKSKQRLRVIRHSKDEHITISCTYGKLQDILDPQTNSAVEEALKSLLGDHFQYKSVNATYNGINIQVDLLN